MYSDEVSTLTYWKSLVLAIEPDCTEPSYSKFCLCDHSENRLEASEGVRT